MAILRCLFSGENANGETVHVSIAKNGIVVTTYQRNGRVRKNYYGADGRPDGEMFDGKWL